MPRIRRNKVKRRDLYREDVDLPRDAAGTRKRVSVYGKTVGELSRKVAELRQQLQTGVYVEPSREPVSKITDRWSKYHRPNIAGSTAENYATIIRCHIKPVIGRVSINKFSPVHVEDVLTKMDEAEISSGRRKDAFSILNMTSKYALSRRLLLFNPCSVVECPRVTRKTELKYFARDEAKRFLDEAKNDRLSALYVLAVTRGIRQGELFGLKPSDIDMGHATLSIQRTVTREGKKLVIGLPKTKKSRRRIELPDMVLDALHDHRKQMMTEGNAAAEWLFCDTRGGLLRCNNFHRSSFKPVLKRAGLPDIRFHDLRHTCATLLLMDGEHPKMVQELLGHEKISTTLDMYSHVIPTMHKESARRMDRMFG